jgi:hypothetical protein
MKPRTPSKVLLFVKDEWLVCVDPVASGAGGFVAGGEAEMSTGGQKTT